MKRIVLLLLTFTLFLAGCSEIMEKSYEGDVWNVEFEAEETSSITFTYLPSNPEDIDTFGFVSSTGITKLGIPLDQNGMHTDNSGCRGCAQTVDNPIDIDMTWVTVDGEEFEKSITLN
ncbi:hypothetical protein [Geomicrobium sediminis]|uniref:Lipoprotein n=1 Tax=Geomicrobium sediminis TaxID=1347788 RepID=A0ABS2P6P4_9BACL|nr:hypothetical protein [Geomicrobium sediminis]MBM7631074.1 hypothetical protein [Geomicrobium sediminis]